MQRPTAGQIRLTFTSSEVGNGAASDSNSLANQDGGLAVRFQAQDEPGNLTGLVSRFDDEGVIFNAAGDVTFDVRDLVSGTERGNFQGGLADDFLVGGDGDDSLSGGFGADSFIGGSGGDRFVFRFIAESSVAVAGRDTIHDFTGNAGDRIDLSKIDAIDGGGADDEFSFVNDFGSAPGELRTVEIRPGQLLVEADVDGDASADFAIVVTTDALLTAADFIL